MAQFSSVMPFWKPQNVSFLLTFGKGTFSSLITFWNKHEDMYSIDGRKNKKENENENERENENENGNENEK